MTAMIKMAAVFATALVAQACGSGLSNTVPEAALATLTAEQKVKVDAARAEVVNAKKLVGEMDAKIKESEKRIERAEDRVGKAEDAVDAANATIERADAQLAAKVSAAAGTRDAAIATANAKYESDATAARAEHAGSPNAGRMETSISSADSIRKAAISVAKANFEQTAAVAKGETGKVQDVNRGVLREKQAALKLEQARLAHEEAVLAERQARKEALEADWWATQAQYELVKLDAVAEAKGTTESADHKERRLEFAEQVADRESAQREASREVINRERTTAKTKAAFDRLNPAPEPPVSAP